jgi:hypothetical protein
MPNTSYAREYSTAIVANLMKESVSNRIFGAGARPTF